jgi:hypothetical protein
MKKLLFTLAAVFFLTSLHAQEENASDYTEAPEDFDFPETAEASQSASFPLDFVMQFEPALYLNTESTLVSAPSPIVYPISIGFLWPNRSRFAIQPSISFFMMQHLLYEDKALPAEIENRTTTTLSFMLNIPVVFSLFLDNSLFQFTAGPGILMRFGLLSPGVKEGDSGWSGSAGSDVEKINEYFWNDMRWFYVSAGGSWLYNLTPQLRAGPTINVYLPVGGLISDQSAQAMIISAGIKICR